MSRHILQLISLVVLMPSPTVVYGSPSAELPGAVRTLFERRCLSCHNTSEQQGDFSLQTRASLFDSGFVIPGKSDESHLIEVLTANGDERPAMPKDSDPLSESEIASLKQWIDAGASWPDGVKLTEPVVAGFDWWSLQPLRRPVVPEFSDPAGSDWIRTPIDAFVLQKHRELSLTPSPEADRRTLIRRLYYDLTGLPPSPQEVDAFVDDASPNAWSNLVNRLLTSPHYGEHWARHWLDVARYADT
ncbi:MAG: DUF1549 domain-containing protein, partial [Planctomycetaceae bacterium]|nr:DUF1549 domain-containing protein [Planctomycetaceae bacterium]